MVDVEKTSLRFHPRRPSLRGEISLPRLWFERWLQMARLYRNWPAALADRIGLRRRNTRVIYRLRCSGGPVELLARTNGSDVRTINEIWIGEFYARFVDPLAARGRQMVIVDIGTNCGYFAVYAGRRFPGARIVCFEPEEENRTLARANLALNKVEADLHPEAVVPERAETITLNLSSDPRLHTTVAPQRAEAHGIETARYGGRAVNVPAVEINEALTPLALAGRIDLLKMDVEGLELALLEALDDVVLESVSCLSAEVGSRDTTMVVDRLEGKGFFTTHDAGLLLAVRATDRKADGDR